MINLLRNRLRGNSPAVVQKDPSLTTTSKFESRSASFSKTRRLSAVGDGASTSKQSSNVGISIGSSAINKRNTKFYYKAGSKKPTELFRTDLISKMRVAGTIPLNNQVELIQLTDKWRRDWSVAVQVPIYEIDAPAEGNNQENKLSSSPVRQPVPQFREIEDDDILDDGSVSTILKPLPPSPSSRLLRSTIIGETESGSNLESSPAPTTIGGQPIRYELDDLDLRWLRLINAELFDGDIRRFYLNENQFEKSIERLEIAYALRCADVRQSASVLRQKHGSDAVFDRKQKIATTSVTYKLLTTLSYSDFERVFDRVQEIPLLFRRSIFHYWKCKRLSAPENSLIFDIDDCQLSLERDREAEFLSRRVDTSISLRQTLDKNLSDESGVQQREIKSRTHGPMQRHFKQLYKKFGRDGKIACRMCSKGVYCGRLVLGLNHVLVNHFGKILFTCRYCSKGYKARSAMNTHIIRQHQETAVGGYVDHSRKYESQIKALLTKCFGMGGEKRTDQKSDDGGARKIQRARKMISQKKTETKNRDQIYDGGKNNDTIPKTKGIAARGAGTGKCRYYCDNCDFTTKCEKLVQKHYVLFHR